MVNATERARACVLDYCIYKHRAPQMELSLFGAVCLQLPGLPGVPARYAFYREKMPSRLLSCKRTFNRTRQDLLC
jgi:hypothetical protein